MNNDDTPSSRARISRWRSLKVAGLIGSGGQAKHLIREGKAPRERDRGEAAGRKIMRATAFQFEECQDCR